MTYPHEPSERSKGTLFGLVLGLIVGLAIAVLAALYITHSPKPQPRKDDESTQQTSKMDAIQKLELQLRESNSADENGAPNTPSVKPAIQEPAAEVQEPQITEVPAAPALAKPQVAQSAQTSKRADSRRTLASTPINNTGYYLQTGAYKTRDGAEQQHARLALQGFPSKVTSRTVGTVVYYRVRLGPFTQLSEVNTLRTQLSDAGIEAMVVSDSK